jgi:hypothetical protein
VGRETAEKGRYYIGGGIWWRIDGWWIYTGGLVSEILCLAYFSATLRIFYMRRRLKNLLYTKFHFTRMGGNHMAKRIVVAMLLTVMVFGGVQLTGACVSCVNGSRIRVSGEFLSFPGGQPPIIISGRTLVPLRDVMEYLGFEVTWDESTREVQLRKEGYDVRVTVYSSDMFVNGQRHSLDVAPRITNDRTMVPLRAISEATGLTVTWDDENHIVDIQ